MNMYEHMALQGTGRPSNFPPSPEKIVTSVPMSDADILSNQTHEPHQGGLLLLTIQPSDYETNIIVVKWKGQFGILLLTVYFNFQNIGE